MKGIQMVDLINQYKKISPEVDKAINEILAKAHFINGPAVKAFERNLEKYLNANHVIGCANGTDALQIAMMALDLERGDEIIVPAFTYVATAEVIALLGLVPVMVDVDLDTFNVSAEVIEQAITKKTKAIIPVHLFGQSCDMEPILHIAEKHNLFVIEDNAQAIGSEYTFSDGAVTKTGLLGHIGCTSFFPSKNLGCFGDGGAIFTQDDVLAGRIRMIANHGQEKKYHHSVIGVNSRLDTIQAAILDIKLARLTQYSKQRNLVADSYDRAFEKIEDIIIPTRQSNSTHVFHQYTLRIKNGHRDTLKAYLAERDIPSMIYYPIPLYKQKAFSEFYNGDDLPITEELCSTVLSLPMHTEMEESTLNYIIENVLNYFSA